MSDALQSWIDAEYRYAASAMLRSVSRVDLVKARPGFAQRITPRAGSIIASPVLASYDPDPDYFFHWYRDSAVVIDALNLLFADGSVGVEAQTHFADFIAFSLSLQQLDGRVRVEDAAWRAPVAADFVQFLRDDADLARAHGDTVSAETRVNPDGTLDISKWTRPQHDGPPLRALAVLRWLAAHPLPASVEAQATALLRDDLAFTFTHWRAPSFDIWEEEQGRHYYTLRVSGAALGAGADWLAAHAEHELAARYRGEAALILSALDDFWLAGDKHYRSRVLDNDRRSGKELDIAVILSAIHVADGRHGSPSHTVADPKMQATLAQLERRFDADYAINHARPEHRGPALGRYHGDVYYSGGAYYFSTLGAAEFCYRAAQLGLDRQAWIARGDAYLETVRAYTPASGELSEQFDQHDGHQSSARHLAWSYAALISCVHARRLLRIAE